MPLKYRGNGSQENIEIGAQTPRIDIRGVQLRPFLIIHKAAA